MKKIIEYVNVSKYYKENTVLKNFNLTVNSGDFITVIGSSGGGKTTLLKMVNGLILPDSGKVFVNGKDISTENLIELRRSIGYAIQGAVLFPHMNVEENISYVPKLIKKDSLKTIKENAIKWLKTVNLDESVLKRYPHELSGGQQQRVGIARALAASPKILLMDEPFGALDKITSDQLQNEILKIYEQTGITILFVTHDISEALKLGSKVLVMDKGELQQFDTPQNIVNNPKTPFVEELVKKGLSECDRKKSGYNF